MFTIDSTNSLPTCLTELLFSKDVQVNKRGLEKSLVVKVGGGIRSNKETISQYKRGKKRQGELKQII